jgi:hypothetical protein
MSGAKEAQPSTSAPFFSIFWIAFVVIKIAGHTLAAWSWWWMFLPFVPVLGLAVQKLGL